MPDGEEFVLEVAVQGAKIVIKDGGLRDKFKKGPEQVARAAWITAQSMAPEVENYMKNEAPWNDQTGNARAGLNARAFKEGDSIGIDLAHSVFYGIFLETKFSGRDAIIQPTIEHMGPIIMARFERLLERY
jgi:hypothetical protein